jgi:hypothetical protein
MRFHVIIQTDLRASVGWTLEEHVVRGLSLTQDTGGSSGISWGDPANSLGRRAAWRNMSEFLNVVEDKVQSHAYWLHWLQHLAQLDVLQRTATTVQHLGKRRNLHVKRISIAVQNAAHYLNYVILSESFCILSAPIPHLSKKQSHWGGTAVTRLDMGIRTGTLLNVAHDQLHFPESILII